MNGIILFGFCPQSIGLGWRTVGGNLRNQIAAGSRQGCRVGLKIVVDELPVLYRKAGIVGHAVSSSRFVLPYRYIEMKKGLTKITFFSKNFGPITFFVGW